MLWVYGQYNFVNSVSAGNDFKRQNLTSTDVRFCCLKTALKELSNRKCIFLTLCSLCCSKNILKFPEKPEELQTSFNRIDTIYLNRMKYSWEQV